MKTKVTRFMVILWMSAVWLVAAASAQSGGQPSDGPYGGQNVPSGDPQVNFPRSGQGGDPQLHYPQSGQPGDPQSDRQPSDPQSGEPQSADPQASVARISLINGDISMQRGDAQEWSAASINTPLLRGDTVATGERSRAEIQLDYANILRLSSRSQARIAELTRTRIQVQISEGYANYTMIKGGEADVEIDTPNVAVHPLRYGRYRVQVNSGEETDVIVREGEAEITTPQGSTTVKEGQMITIRGAENPEYKVSGAPGSDDWDRFNKDRDRQIRDAASWHRTNAYYTGSHDLDAYGRWIFVPGYGWVWQPYEQSISWAPYQSGRWVWEPYYGWTWVSYEPWGWAPYHYGRWFYWGASWVWWPGPIHRHYRPIWGPAFVTFIGFGGHSGVGFGFGHIGWLPCGPHDYFYPWYGRGGTRVNVVNITNITVLNNRHGVVPLAGAGRGRGFSNLELAQRDPRVRGAISGVSAEDFGRGNAHVGRLDLKEGDLRQARIMTAAVPVVPTHDSLRTGGAGRTPEQLGIRNRNQDRFFTRQQPAAGPPSFHDQQNQMQNVIQGRTGSVQVPAQGRGREEFHTQPGAVNRTGVPDARGKAEGPVTSGSTGAQTPGTAQQPMDNGRGRATRPTNADRGNTTVDQNPNRGGWSKFGTPGGRSASGDSGRINNAPPPNNPRIDNAQVPRVDRGNAPESTHQGGGVSTPSTNNAPPQRNEDRGWQRFPSNSGDRNRGTSVPSQTNDRSSKPPLQLDRPIVTPRTEVPRAETPRNVPPPVSAPRPEIRNEPRNSPPPSRAPEVRSQPRYSPPPSRAPEVRSAPSHDRGSSGGGGHDRGGNRGGGDKSSSKSSSNPKNR